MLKTINSKTKKQKMTKKKQRKKLTYYKKYR